MTIMATKSRVISVTREASISSGDDSDGSVINSDENMQAECESDRDSNSSGEIINDQDDLVTNTGWADSIAKILKTNKPKGKKTLVLSKAKKLTDVVKTKITHAGFEVEAQDGERKREQIELSEPVDEDRPLRKKRKEIPSVRVKPNILEKDRERTLAKIATKGVVQLFNAVKKQQKDMDIKLKEAGPLEVKRDKVLKGIDKREFLHVLMGDKSHMSENIPQTQKVTEKPKKKESEGSTWSILRDDFMMGAKMKDWDKEIEDETELEKDILEEVE